MKLDARADEPDRSVERAVSWLCVATTLAVLFLG